MVPIITACVWLLLAAPTGCSEDAVELTRQHFDNFIASHERVLAVFYESSCPHCKAFLPEYAKVARWVKGEELDTQVVKVEAQGSSELMVRFNLTATPVVLYFQNGKRQEISSPLHEAKAHAILSWLRTKELGDDESADSYPTVGSHFSIERYGPKAMKKLGYDGSVVVLLDDLSADTDLDNGALVKPQLLPELFRFAQADSQWLYTTAEITSLSDRELKFLAVEKGRSPVVVVLRGKKRFVLDREDEITNTSALGKFLKGVWDGKVNPVLKLVTMDSDGITEVVSDTFKKIVLDASLDVFVYYYTNQCDHCKELAPVWAQLGRSVREHGWRERGVIIARMNVEEHDVAEEDLMKSGIPKLVLYPAVASAKKFKAKRVYSWTRLPEWSLDSLVDFVLESAKNLEGVEKPAAKPVRKKYSQVERELEHKRKTKSEEL